jgi:hypothetical protein
MTPATLADVLEELLVSAEQSHLAHEVTHPGTDWPPYYAEYLHRALGSEYALEQVSSALRSAAAAHGIWEEQHGGVRDEAWPRWYAEHMAGTLSRDWYRQLAELEAWDS